MAIDCSKGRHKIFGSNRLSPIRQNRLAGRYRITWSDAHGRTPALSFACALVLLSWATDQLVGAYHTDSGSQHDDGLYIVMSTLFVLLGVLLAAFLSFPGFSITAIACSISYSLDESDGTIIGYIVNLLSRGSRVQLGFSVMAMNPPKVPTLSPQ
jgi:hypothetical protein